MANKEYFPVGSTIHIERLSDEFTVIEWDRFEEKYKEMIKQNPEDWAEFIPVISKDGRINGFRPDSVVKVEIKDRIDDPAPKQREIIQREIIEI